MIDSNTNTFFTEGGLHPRPIGGQSCPYNINSV